VIIAIIFAIFPPPLNWTVLLVIPAIGLFVLNAIWVSIVFGILSTRFRDIGQLLTTVVQLVFFMTPIIWSTQSLTSATGEESSRLKIVELNPMFHYLEITRGPLLGESVQFYHWAIVIGCTVVGWVLAMLVMRNYRARVAYWV
jgi:ABC-2 type transport system permease protein